MSKPTNKKSVNPVTVKGALFAGAKQRSDNIMDSLKFTPLEDMQAESDFARIYSKGCNLL